MPTYPTWSTAFHGVVEECLVTLPNGRDEWPALYFNNLRDFLALTREMATHDESLRISLRECQNKLGRIMLERQIAGASLSIELCMLMGECEIPRFLWKIPPEKFVRRGPLMEIYLTEYSHIAQPNPLQAKLLRAILATVQLHVTAGSIAGPNNESKKTEEDAKQAPAQVEPTARPAVAPETVPVETSQTSDSEDIIMEDSANAANDTTVAAAPPEPISEPPMDTPTEKPNHPKTSSSATTPKVRIQPTKSQASAKRPTEELLRRPSLEIPNESRIAKILKKGGYKQTDGTWTRPNGFTETYSMNELRRDMCKNGVNCRCKSTREETVACQCWSVEDKGDLFHWVRSDIFTKPMDTYLLFNSTHAVEHLLALGFRRRRGLYDCPVSVLQGFTDGELFRELAKAGLPSVCNFDAITDEDLFSLECFLALNYRYTFKHRPERRRLSYTPVATKPTRKKRLPTSPSTVVTNDDVETNTKKRHSASNRKGAKKRKSSPVPPTPEVEDPPAYASPEVEYHVTEAGASLPVIAPQLANQKIKPFEDIPKNDYSEPEFNGTDAEKLRSASAALSLSNRFDSPSFQSDQPSRFTESMSTVYKFLQESVLNRTQEVSADNRGSNALYVCGVPGIGKTSGVHWCCDQFVEANNDVVKTELKVCKINASSLLAGNSNPLNDVVGEVKRVLGMASNANLDAVRRRLARGASSGLAKSFLVLVVDEIDALMTSKKLKVVFKNLMGLSSDSMCQFALIGISNSISDRKYVQMQSADATFGQSVTFSAYSEQELLHILKARVGSSLVNHAALSFVAKKVSLSSGDARSALDMLSTAIQRRLETASEEFSTDGPLITMHHVHLVSRGEKETSVKAIIEGQSTAMKSLLCVLVSLSQSGVVEATLGQLRNWVSDCLMRSGQDNDVLHFDDFCLSVELLADHGLIRLSHKSSPEGFLLGLSIAERAKQPVCLGTQLDEVQKVLETDLKQSFYRTIRDEALRMGRNESGKATN